MQPVELLVLRGDQTRPVEAALAEAPAEAGGILEAIRELGAVDQELLRHAAAQHAGAANANGFRNPHLGAVGARPPRARHTARARADGEEIEIIPGHVPSPSQDSPSVAQRAPKR